jgi:hypothetical protein
MLRELDESTQPTMTGLKAKANEKVREFGAVAKGRAEERLRELGSKASDQIDEQRERIATRVDGAAESPMEHADHANGLPHDVEERVAFGMESAAGYLHSRDAMELARDARGFLRRHPLRALIIGLIGGYLLVRMLR